MSQLSREQVEKLSAEQQEALGTVEMRRLRRRQQLLKKARGSWAAMWLGAFLLYILGIGTLHFMAVAGQGALAAIFTLLFAFLITQFQVSCIKRRQDALMEPFDAYIQDTGERGDRLPSL